MKAGASKKNLKQFEKSNDWNQPPLENETDLNMGIRPNEGDKNLMKNQTQDVERERERDGFKEGNLVKIKINKLSYWKVEREK